MAAPTDQVVGTNSTPGWVVIDYSEIADLRRPTHSGDSIGAVLRRLGGRPRPLPGERPADEIDHRLIEPLLEPQAFVLPDYLDSVEPSPEPPMVEVGSLWTSGETQPAWAELLRARRYVVESDGQGRLRAFLPLAAADAGRWTGVEPESAARGAWQEAWPVLRHVLASERLGRNRTAAGGSAPPAEVEVRAYAHRPERTAFALSLLPYRVRVEDTGPPAGVPPFDPSGFRPFLDGRLALEGGRLEADGTLRLVGSESPVPATLLGARLDLADFAVAYRAVFHGGIGEPYMSLDRGDSPETSIVNYGGRLRDTSLGYVSLLSDIRFKTFSQGVDVIRGRDVRESIRRAVPGFMTHLERLAGDPRSATVTGQQTRLWFYPDEVDVALSSRAEAMLIRRARMSAASERVSGGDASTAADPPWTLATVAALNASYDALAREFPELQDLDRTARLLTFFAWLKHAAAEAVRLPDLDALLAVPLPSRFTPRRFPQLLAFDVLPAAGRGPVDVFPRLDVVDALVRLQPDAGKRLDAPRRARRVLSALDRREADHAAVARDIESALASGAEATDLDVRAFAAERLIMHQLVRRTLSAADRARAGERQSRGESLRSFSVGIGGVDLDMGRALSRAVRKEQRLAWGGAAPASARTARDTERAPAGGADAASDHRTSGEPPVMAVPDHGFRSEDGSGSAVRDGNGHRIERQLSGDPSDVSYSILTVHDVDGPEVRARGLSLGLDRRARAVERLEDGRFVRFRFERTAAEARVVAEAPTSPTIPGSAPESASALRLPERLAALWVLPSGAASAATGGTESRLRIEPPDDGPVRLRVLTAGRAPVDAAFPRSVLRRLILGRRVDGTPDRTLPGLTPPSEVVGTARSLMVFSSRSEHTAPWTGPTEAIPGEENPVRIAAALDRWWVEGTRGEACPRVVVGTDTARSPSRWSDVPALGRQALLLLPNDAFPPPMSPMRDEILAKASGGRAVSALPTRKTPAVVVLVSAEPPGLLARRLRELSRDPMMRGRILAVRSLAGPIRADVPASLLAEGTLAALGVSAPSPAEVSSTPQDVADLVAAVKGRAKGLRPEDLPGTWVWYY